jgi:ATP-dependent exoDNAse (exonuclease V) beta subunit
MSKELYFSSNPTIRYILDILTFLDDIEDDVAFVSVITSPYFSISASEVIKLCKGRSSLSSLASFARYYAKSETDELSQKLTNVFEFLDKYSELAMYQTVKDTVSSIIVDLDYFDRIIRTKGIKEADVLSLYLDALNACPYAETLDGYLRFIENGGDKCDVKPEDNCVNIMTVHASKGLEFPYVYLINSEKSKSGDGSSLCLMNKELGLAIKTIDLDNKTYEDNALYSLIKEIDNKKIKEESARLLYVALTRPQEGLYIYASVKESEKNNFYEGNPIASDTLFGWMSESIQRLGFRTVDGTDVKIENKRSDVQIVDLSMADENFVSALENRFAVMDGIYESSPNQKLKTSVTGIAVQETEQEYPQVDNERKRKSKDDPIKKGNAYHKTMELLNFELDFETAFNKVESFAIADFELVNKEKIQIAYERVKPLLDGAKAYKEKSFIYNDGTQLVQGIIDLLIIKDGVAIVVDYKTTSLYSLAQEKTMAEYKVQVGIYAEAVREIVGLQVDKVMLYSFEKDDFIQL